MCIYVSKCRQIMCECDVCVCVCLIVHVCECVYVMHIAYNYYKIKAEQVVKFKFLGIIMLIFN